MRARPSLAPWILLQSSAFIVVFFVALPSGFIALNRWMAWPRVEGAAFDVAGTALVVLGIGIFAWGSGLFWRYGLGTPAPNVQPPSRLVIRGMYRHTRNPMYVAYLAIAIGIGLIEGHLSLLLYVLALFLIAQIYIVRVEEPGLVRRFGSAYEEYRRSVPRWLGRRRVG